MKTPLDRSLLPSPCLTPLVSAIPCQHLLCGMPWTNVLQGWWALQMFSSWMSPTSVMGSPPNCLLCRDLCSRSQWQEENTPVLPACL